MQERYYLDTCIWRDYFENRSDKFRPLGEWAFRLIKKILREDNIIIVSKLVEEELSSAFSDEKIKEILGIVPKDNTLRAIIDSNILKKAIKLSRVLKIPTNDALHALIAKKYDSVLVTRDKHFYKLSEEVEVRTPEELI